MSQKTKLIAIFFISMTLLVMSLTLLLSVCATDCSNTGMPLLLKLGTSALAVVATLCVHKFLVLVRGG